MNNDLATIYKDQFTFESLRSAKAETKKSKLTLSQNATDFNQKYSRQIEEGTRKRQLMLEHAGIQDGTPEAERLFVNNESFIPTVHTPILNFLYFLNNEYSDVVENLDVVRSEYDSKYGQLTDDFTTGDKVPHMEKYIYQNMDAGTFGKLKKLKALTHSPNDEEASAAWKKCMEICNKFKIDFNSIPCKL